MNTVDRKLALTVTPITVAELRANSAREYNAKEWDKKIDIYDKESKKAQFYMKPADAVFSYDRFFVKHTIEEGITFFSQFSYSSGISSNSFCLIEIEPNEATGEVNIFKSYYEGENGKAAGIANQKEGRAWMAKRSKGLGEIFANGI